MYTMQFVSAANRNTYCITDLCEHTCTIILYLTIINVQCVLLKSYMYVSGLKLIKSIVQVPILGVH